MFRRIFNFKVLKSDLILLLITVIFAGISFLFSPSIAYENGPIEDLQALILFVGMIMCIRISKKKIKMFDCREWQAGAILFFIAFARELSWGRVFYPSSGINSFIPLQNLWFGSAVYPILGMLILAVLYIFCRYNLFAFLKKSPLPFWHFGAIFALLIIAGLAEHYAHGSLGLYDGEVLEEIFELMSYLFMVDTVLIMSGKHE